MRGGNRGGGRPRGKKDSKPRTRRTNVELGKKQKPKKSVAKPDPGAELSTKIKKLLDQSANVKGKALNDLLTKMASGEKLTATEIKTMGILERELSEMIDGGSNQPIDDQELDADEFLRQVWNDPSVEMALRIRAAEIVSKGDGPKGKKQEREDKAKRAGTGKFAIGQKPKLATSNGKAVK